jgi:hypothetical protein
MGMNYYYHTDICEHCKRSVEVHVGKSANGWSFSFRSYRDGAIGGLQVESLADWEKLFKTTPGILVDEEQRVIENPLQFLAELERPSVEQQESEDSPGRLGGHIRDPRCEWRDPEGFHFYDGVFS